MNSQFSIDYSEARERFRRAAERLGFRVASYPLRAGGTNGDRLAIDVAVSEETPSDRALVISSGMHGVEGPVGSAVQLALLEDCERSRIDLQSTRVVLIHAINPFGFAWRRRFNEDNVDLNRNLLFADQMYVGSPERYAELHRYLNPDRRPSRWEPTTLKMLAAIARYGGATLRQTIGGGQYEFPKGLYYGGAQPTESHTILSKHFDDWLGTSRHVMHFDIHTGLGLWAACKLLIDYEMSPQQRQRLDRWFGTSSYEVMHSRGISFAVRGSFGRWTTARYHNRDYLYASAEFGTYRATQVLHGLRAENQAHHWGTAADLEYARRRLTELFCPRSERWRKSVLATSRKLIAQAIAGLVDATTAV